MPKKIPLRVEWVTIHPDDTAKMESRGFTIHSEIVITPHHPQIGSAMNTQRNGKVWPMRAPRVLMWRERTL